jgi:hypothetical protein
VGGLPFQSKACVKECKEKTGFPRTAADVDGRPRTAGETGLAGSGEFTCVNQPIFHENIFVFMDLAQQMVYDKLDNNSI